MRTDSGAPLAAGIVAPYLEMGLGLSLLFPRTRRVGVIGILVMHVLLLAMLGPWSLGWNSVVWPWNLAMVVLVPGLFWHLNYVSACFLKVARSFCAVHDRDNDVLFVLEQPSGWLYRSGWHSVEQAREFCLPLLNQKI